MKYHIKVESGEIIVSCINECDRDTCIEALRDLYDDYIFDVVNGE